MAEIVKLHKQRRWIKAKLTRLETMVDRVPEDQINREETETYLARLEEIQNEFEKIQHEININLESELDAADTTEDAEFEERYLKLKVKLNRWSNDLTVQQAESRSSASDEAFSRVLHQQGELIRRMSLLDSGAQASSSGGDAITRLFEQQTQLLRSIADGTANQESRVKLPVVKLPTFDGRTEEWKRFSETFKSMIHSNENIPNIQKLQHLVTLLSGNASKIIESIELSDSNYKVAWELLQRRFDDPRAIKRSISSVFSRCRRWKRSQPSQFEV